MSDESNPLEDAVEQALDTFLYAPIGLVFDGPALFPKLVESGRNQVKVARMMGEMAVQMGQGKATKHVTKAQDHVRESLAALGLVPGGSTVAEPARAPKTSPARRTTTATTRPSEKKPVAKKPVAKKSVTKRSAPKKATAVPSVSPEGLAIPDYDSLSASQVVKRLGGLASSELDAVKAYESATRARKTVLNRITQLQKG